jgi:hypothetical protein
VWLSRRQHNGQPNMGGNSGLVATCIRTLVASGYAITGSTRQLRHIEVSCQRRTAIGAEVRFLVALTDAAQFSHSELEELHRVAARQGQALALVAGEPGSERLSAAEFLVALGGVIPSWRALLPEFASWLRTAADASSRRGPRPVPSREQEVSFGIWRSRLPRSRSRR